MTVTLTPELAEQVREEAERRHLSPEQVAQEAMIAALRDRPTPQSLDEIAPRRPVPPGKTWGDVLAELDPWPGEETDAELQAALKALDD